MDKMELFISFAESFTVHQGRWNKLFDGKLKIDELTNERVNLIRRLSSIYPARTKVRLAMDILFHDDPKFNTYVYHMNHMGFTDVPSIISHMLNWMEPYKVGKIFTSLKTDPIFADVYTNDTIIPQLFGPGSADGIYIITRKTNHIEEYPSFLNQLMSKLKAINSILYQIFRVDHLLLEDYLCEFHMFYRLFGDKMPEHSPEVIIEMIDRDKIYYIELSEYIDSELPYDKHQKQYIRCMKIRRENDYESRSI